MEISPESETKVRTTARVLWEVGEERKRQDKKWGEQNHPDGTGSPAFIALREQAKAICDEAEGKDQTWSNILNEEHFEALAEKDQALLRAELVQVCAVGVAWIESIDRRSKR